MNMENSSTDRCPDRCGTLPSCAPLATGYVPFQQTGGPRYGQRDALSNGTLFPALNLPFHLAIPGSKVSESPLGELQALCFVLQELALYLDTHPDDAEAFALFKQYAAMEKTARENVEKTGGPLLREQTAQDSKYTWLNDPWPWNIEHNEVK